MQQLRAHEFLSPVRLRYKDCVRCGLRKSLVCVRCDHCYECHAAIE
jgi:hypothetical protein